MPQPIDDDLALLAGALGLSLDDLRSDWRDAPTSRARAAVCYLLRQAGYTTIEIGAALRRDRSTVSDLSIRARDRARTDAATRTLVVIGRAALRRDGDG